MGYPGLHVNLHQLNVFQAIVETGSFSKAARSLRIAQSAVSYHIKTMETAIGEPLFLRVKTRVFLTETGKVLWKHVERIFQAVGDAQREMEAHAERRGGELHLGLGVSSLCEKLPAFVVRLRELCPGVVCNVAMGSSPQMMDLLRSNKVDLAVVSLPVDDRGISTIPLFYEEEEMLVVTHKSSPLARRREVAATQLVTTPLILYQPTTATRASLDQFFRQAGVTPQISMEVDREETILSLVRNGLGATILPRCVLPQPPNGSLRYLRLRDAWLRRQVAVVLLESAVRPRLVESALGLCREHFR